MERICRARRPRRPGPQAFTLVEILIVVVIIGILAAIVVPQFTSAASESRDNSIKMTVFRIRTQLEIYRQHHGGNYPSLAEFEAQLTQASNAIGDTAAPGTIGYPFGPYLRSLPKNANNGSAEVTDGAVGTSGWYYEESTGAFHANDSAETRAF